jgi:hypothetical protein
MTTETTKPKESNNFVFAASKVVLTLTEQREVERLKAKYIAKGVSIRILKEIEKDLHSLIVDSIWKRSYVNIKLEEHIGHLDALDKKYYLKLKLINFKIKVFLFFRRIYKKLFKIKNKFILGNRLNDESKEISFIKFIEAQFRP